MEWHEKLHQCVAKAHACGTVSGEETLVYSGPDGSCNALCSDLHADLETIEELALCVCPLDNNGDV